MGGSLFPIIGRIDFRTFNGLRRSDPFEYLQYRMKIVMNELKEDQYSVVFLPGNVNGTVIFNLYLENDHYFDSKIMNATFYYD